MPTVTLRAFPHQRRFLGSAEANVVLQGGARCGKTWTGALQALLLAGRYPTCIGMVVAPTYKQLNQAIVPHLETIAADLGIAQRMRWNKQSGEIRIPHGGTILLRSAENPASLLGATLGWAVCDEVALWRKQAYNYLQDRLSDPAGPRQCFFTFTPKGRNWAWDVLGTPRPGLEIIKATTLDNLTLPEDYHERLRREHGEGTLYWRQEVLGEYVAWEGLVYPQFDHDKHVCPVPALEDRQFAKVVAGVDWGWTNPGVVVVLAVDAQGRVWLCEESYQREVSVPDWAAEARRLKDKWGVTEFFCDPSEPGNIAEFARAGLPARAANNEVLPGIATVASLFAGGRIAISPDATNTLSELGMYCWKQRADGTIRNDEPDKQNDHGMDALRYAAMGLLTQSSVTIEVW